MKHFILMALLFSSANALAQSIEGYEAKGLYSVEFTSTMGGCLKETAPETFTLHFGPRDKTAHCVDNPKLTCTTRYTNSIMKNGFALASDGPAICEKGQRERCSEVQFKFVPAPGTGEDTLSLQGHDIRNGKLFTPPPRLLKISDLLDQTKRYVVSIGACEYTQINFKVRKRSAATESSDSSALGDELLFSRNVGGSGVSAFRNDCVIQANDSYRSGASAFGQSCAREGHGRAYVRSSAAESRVTFDPRNRIYRCSVSAMHGCYLKIGDI